MDDNVYSIPAANFFQNCIRNQVKIIKLTTFRYPLLETQNLKIFKVTPYYVELKIQLSLVTDVKKNSINISLF